TGSAMTYTINAILLPWLRFRLSMLLLLSILVKKLAPQQAAGIIGNSAQPLLDRLLFGVRRTFIVRFGDGLLLLLLRFSLFVRSGFVAVPRLFVVLRRLLRGLLLRLLLLHLPRIVSITFAVFG